MFSNLSLDISTKSLSFSDYLAECRAMVEKYRTNPVQINANCPFELYPENPSRVNGKVKYGALLIHGLLDCPFSLRDIGSAMQEHGILCRSILLPGHGTSPADLLAVTYQEWIQAVRYGIESLRQDAEEIILVGYSTGATLAINQALQDPTIAKIILLSPAIKIKAPVDIAVAWHKFVNFICRKPSPWMYREKETDYAKYRSVPFNAIAQVARLTKVTRELSKTHKLTLPVCMVLAREDETISSQAAIDYFSQLPNPSNQLLLYTSRKKDYADTRITTHNDYYPMQHIQHASHISIPFAPKNPHYGLAGDYDLASRPNNEQILYGAYNRIETELFKLLNSAGLTKYQRRELTYNPDFKKMSINIANFVLKVE
jgi:esterase/lipase